MSEKTTPDSHVVARFEGAMQELEQLVARMEAGEQPLEKALEDFERGVALTRLCQQALDVAEQRVRTLTADTPTTETETVPRPDRALDDDDLPF